MPLKRCQKDGENGWKWGDEGTCYIGPGARERALRQGRAIESGKHEGKSAMNEPNAETEAEAAKKIEDAAAALDPEALDDEETPLEELDDVGPALEVKRFAGGIREVKQEIRNGIPVGILTGYLSTWAPDTGGRFGVPDKFEPGAWAKSLAEHRQRGNRPVRLKDLHGRTVGGFPIETMREDEVGLYGVGEINLETQAGREIYSLARQGVLSDFSVGFISTLDRLETGMRRIFEAILLEGSVVDEPANQGARIIDVKRTALYRAADVKGMTTREVERALHESGAFSRRASRILAARIAPPLTPPAPRYDQGTAEKADAILRELKATRDDLR